jgi:hypothetical protein
MTTSPLPPPPSHPPRAPLDPPLLHQKPLPPPQALPQTDRDASGRFVPGNKVTRRGHRHRVTTAMENLMAGQWEAITQTVIQAALRGDMAAAKLVVERISPPRRGSVVTLDDFPAASAALVSAVANGQISAEEAAPISKMLAEYVTAAEATTQAARLDEIERRLAGGERTIDHGES